MVVLSLNLKMRNYIFVICFICSACIKTTDCGGGDNQSAANAAATATTTFSRYKYNDDFKRVDRLLRNYDRRMLPTHNQNIPTLVSCEFFLGSISSVNPVTMDYEVDLYLRQSWKDTRMLNANLSRPLDISDPNFMRAIWKPEVLFANAKHATFQMITVPNFMLRIHPTGDIVYLLRLRLTFSCVMDLTKYPFDTQIVTMEMASFSKTVNELVLEWTPSEPIRLVSGLKLPQYEIVQKRTSQCNAYIHQGEYSCIMAELFLKRSIGFHLLQSYVPSVIILLTSWLSFWLDVEAVPARTTLGIATLLTMSVKSEDVQEKLPPASYVKAIDVWLGACTAFVFAAVLEFAFVNCKSRSSVATEQLADDKQMRDEIAPSTLVTPVLNKERAAKFDSISRVAFPIGFLIFNILYWPYYLCFT